MHSLNHARYINSPPNLRHNPTKLTCPRDLYLSPPNSLEICVTTTTIHPPDQQPTPNKFLPQIYKPSPMTISQHQAKPNFKP